MVGVPGIGWLGWFEGFGHVRHSRWRVYARLCMATFGCSGRTTQFKIWPVATDRLTGPENESVTVLEAPFRDIRSTEYRA